MNIYDFKVKTQEGKEISLSKYKGKVLLIVNTATGCGFTPQYVELQSYYDEFNEKGLEILDFPCNQFGGQAPGTDEEIHSFCTGRFGIKFPQFAKIDVNGENAVSLYKWLVENTSFSGFGNSEVGLMMTQLLKSFNENFDKDSSIKWNFTKFLVSKEGKIIERFEPTQSMDVIKEKIKELL